MKQTISLFHGVVEIHMYFHCLKQGVDGSIPPKTPPVYSFEGPGRPWERLK